MATTLDESFFPPIHELDPSKRNQCIYFTLKGMRCKCALKESDIKEAAGLRVQILAPSNSVADLELLQRYALLNCCGQGTKQARHRNRIEDRQLLMPLAIRWQNELKKRIVAIATENTKVAPLEDATDEREPGADDDPSSPAPATPVPAEAPAHGIEVDDGSVAEKAERTLLSPPPDEQDSVSATTGEPRYTFRRRGTGASGSITKPVAQVPLSEFRPHIAAPEADDTVVSKLRMPLEGRDFRYGSLYIFKRDRSPGYVKIGWTGSTVQRRLDDWAKCGYTPRLVFSVERVPHAQRAETLAHYEMIHEWRAERRCAAEWCQKSHQEWFQVTEQRAREVVAGWAAFFKSAKPYTAGGVLEETWSQVLQAMEKRLEPITSKKLLEYHTKASQGESESGKPAKLGSSTARLPRRDLRNFMVTPEPDSDSSGSIVSNDMPGAITRNLKPQADCLFDRQNTVQSLSTSPPFSKIHSSQKTVQISAQEVPASTLTGPLESGPSPNTPPPTPLRGTA